jgi:hypothetical protein
MIFVCTGMSVEAEANVSRGDMETELGLDVPSRTAIEIGQHRPVRGLKVIVKMRNYKSSQHTAACFPLVNVNGVCCLDVV